MLRWPPAPGRSYLDGTRYRFVIDRFSRFLIERGITEMSRITSGVIDQYVRERSRDVHPHRRTKIGPEGVESDMRALRRAFYCAIERGYLDKNPVKGNFDSKSGEAMPFTDEEIEAMLRCSQTRVQNGHPIDLSAIIKLFLNTGLRISDVIYFPKSAIRGDWIHLVTRKRGRTVRIPLDPATREALARWAQSGNELQRRSPLMFSTDTGKPIKNLDGYLRRLWVQAGITGAHAHRFRHTFAVQLLEEGASLYDVANLLGISMAVCERHYAPYVKELQERAQRLVASLHKRIKKDKS